MRLSIVEMAERRVEAVRLVGLAQELGLGPQVLSRRGQVGAVGEPGDELGRIAGLAGQVVQILGEGVAALRLEYADRK